MGELIVLEDEHTSAAFDSRFGHLVRLRSNTSGWESQRRAELAASYRLLAPLPDRRNHVIDGSDHELAAWEKSADGRTLVLRWVGPVSPKTGEALDISIEVKVTLAQGVLSFDCLLTNTTDLVIEAFMYPIIGDLSSAGRPLDRLAVAKPGASSTPLYPRFGHQYGYWGTENPKNAASHPTTPYVLLQTEGEGLYLGCHDDSVAMPVQFGFELLPGASSSEGIGTEGRGLGTPEVPPGDSIGGHPVHIEAMAIHMPFLAPHTSLDLPTIALGPYQGTWHSGADIYKDWRPWDPIEPPAWASEPHSWYQIQLTSHQEENRYRYEDLIPLAQDCVDNGISAIQITGWTLGGQDGRLPCHDTDPSLGTWQELKDAIRRMQAMGLKVILYTKYTFADISTDQYRSDLHRLAARDEYGNSYTFGGYAYETATQLAGINTRRLAIMCTQSEEYQALCEAEFIKAMDLGADGILYDESDHHGPAKYCFAENHGHAVPGYLYGADQSLAKRLQEAAAAVGMPDSLLCGEACHDVQFREYGMSYFRTVPTLRAMYRYTAPRAAMMMAVSGYNDRNLLNACLLRRYIISYEPRHFRGRLSEFPDTLEYGKAIDRLRIRHRNSLWDGDYQDSIGANVTVDGEEWPTYSVFEGSESRALVIMNATDSSVEATYEFGRPSEPILLVEPDDVEGRPAPTHVQIPPRSVVALIQSV